MHINKKYRLTIEDESSLEKKVDFSSRFIWWLLILCGFVVAAGILGMFILASTPMKNYLPGYLKDSERTATEEQHLRLDSLVKVYEINEAYINGILSALNPSEDNTAKERMERKTTPLLIDSLLPPSDEEKQFMDQIRERDKYNISYVSPAAAQTMMFGTVNNAAIISEESKEKYKAEIILPVGSPITTIAEGKIISVAANPEDLGGYDVIIQHPKGFLSKTSRLSNLLVQPGDRVSGGQIIASSATARGLKNNHIFFELWHDGDPLVPSHYIKAASQN